MELLSVEIIGHWTQLHDEIDAAVCDAYGWPHDLSDEEIVARVLALNLERAGEEAKGKIRWLRPEYQAPTASQSPSTDTLKPNASPGSILDETTVP